MQRTTYTSNELVRVYKLVALWCIERVTGQLAHFVLMWQYWTIGCRGVWNTSCVLLNNTSITVNISYTVLIYW